MTRLNLSLSLFVLLSASAALAAPKVGDKVVLEGTIIGQGVAVNVSSSQEVTAYNVNTDVFTIHQAQVIGGQPMEQDINAAATNVLTEEIGAMVVGDCTARAIGTAEHLKTAAGEFDTCKVVDTSGALLWFAAVPFGIVKLQTEIDIGTVTIEAASVVRGK